jgi:hypothetical protein
MVRHAEIVETQSDCKERRAPGLPGAADHFESEPNGSSMRVSGTTVRADAPDVGGALATGPAMWREVAWLWGFGAFGYVLKPTSGGRFRHGLGTTYTVSVSAESVTLILECAECGKPWLPGAEEARWAPTSQTTSRLRSPSIVPECAGREFK